MKRYYYKTLDNKGFLNLKTPLEVLTGYEEITEEEFNNLHSLKKKLTEGELKAIKEKREIETRIAELKSLLSSSDYKVMKYLEGYLNELEYLPVKSQRQAWREEINLLETKLRGL